MSPMRAVRPMQAVSAAELEAETGGATGEGLAPTRIRDGVWVLPQPTGTPHPPRFTLSYLIEDEQGRLHLVDPGIDGAGGENRGRLTALLRSIGRTERDLAMTVVTHLHADHLGLAEHLQREHAVPLALHRADQEAARSLADAAPCRAARLAARLEEWGVPQSERAALVHTTPSPAPAQTPAQASPTSTDEPLRHTTADLLLDDDDLLDIPGRSLRVLPTPGHTPGHIALVDEGERLLLTGDHLLPSMFPGIGLGGPTPDAIGDYLHSLDALEPFARVESDDDPGFEVLPGHGYRFTGLADRVDATRRHHVRRSHEVAAVLAESPSATTWQIAERIHWTVGFHGLHGLFLLSALTQTALHTAHLARGAH